jgi:hypothetical protein
VEEMIVFVAFFIFATTGKSADLPSGFFYDIDGISFDMHRSHLCALQAKPGVSIGGVATCWGQDNDYGRIDPPQDVSLDETITNIIYIISSVRFPSCKSCQHHHSYVGSDWTKW